MGGEDKATARKGTSSLRTFQHLLFARQQLPPDHISRFAHEFGTGKNRGGKVRGKEIRDEVSVFAVAVKHAEQGAARLRMRLRKECVLIAFLRVVRGVAFLRSAREAFYS